MRILTFASVVAVGGALRLESLAVSSRRNAIALGATALVTPLAGRAFDLPALEEFDDPKARKFAARQPNPPATKQQWAAFYAVTTGDNDSLTAMADNGWELAKVSDTAGKTVLHRAAQVGNTPAVALLLKQGAKIDAVTQWKETPLHMAARNGKLDSVKALVEAGAQVSKETIGGDTALSLARKYKFGSVEEYLAGK